MAIIHFIGTIVIYNEASSQLISIRNSITIVILFPLLCIYWLLGSLEMALSRFGDSIFAEWSRALLR